MARDLAVIIPAREEWLCGRTVEDILAHTMRDTEVIVCLDGWEPSQAKGDTLIPSDPRVRVIRFGSSVGQRVAINMAARTTDARFILKTDAHCSFNLGFDEQLITPYERGELGWDTTSVPKTVKLLAWQWVCQRCGWRQDQCAKPTCPACKHSEELVKEIVWFPKIDQRADYGRFDKTLQFKYWLEWRKRPGLAGPYVPLMCLGGGCWMMSRGRFWQLGGLDEAHGGWGQMGVEIALKSWLSGGRQVVNEHAWYAHMFRATKDFSFPYKLAHADVEAAKVYSRALWTGNRWPCQVRPLAWLPAHFEPVPEWHEPAPAQREKVA